MKTWHAAGPSGKIMRIEERSVEKDLSAPSRR